MSYNPNFESIGQAFVAAYYAAFDVSDPNARATSLSALYDVSFRNSPNTTTPTRLKSNTYGNA